MAEAALAAPLGATTDIAGPDRLPMSELVGRCLKAIGDPRQVVADPKASYFGACIDDQSLVPRGAVRGAIV